MYFLFYFNILLLCVTYSSSDKLIEKLSNIEWQCADENFSVPISLAKPKQSYSADHRVKVSFSGYDEIKIFGKPIDNKENLWLVSVGDKFGVASETLLRESNILIPLRNRTTAKYDFSKFKNLGKSGSPINSNIELSPQTGIDYSTIEKHDDSSDFEVTFNNDDSSSENVATLENPVNNSNHDDGSTESINESGFSSNDSNNSLDLRNDSSINNLSGLVVPKQIVDSTSQSINDTSADSMFMNPTDAKTNDSDLSEKQNVTSPEADPSVGPQTVSKVQIQKEEISDSGDNVGLSSTKDDSVNAGVTYGILKGAKEDFKAEFESDVPISQNDTAPTNQNNNDSSLQDDLSTEPKALNHTEPGKESNGQQTLQTADSHSTNVKNLNITHTPKSSVLEEPPVSNDSPKPDDTNSENDDKKSSLEDQEHETPLVDSPFDPVVAKASTQDLENTTNYQSENLTENLQLKKDSNFDEKMTALPESDKESNPEPQLSPEEPSRHFLHIPSEPNVDFVKSISQGEAKSEDTIQLPETPLVSDPAQTPMENISSFSNTLLPEDGKRNLVSEDSVKPPTIENLDKEDNSFDKKQDVLEPQQEIEKVVQSTELPEVGTLEPPSDISEESTTNWFSPVSSVMNSIIEMFGKSDIGVDDTKTFQEFTSEKISDPHFLNPEKQPPLGDFQNVCEKDNYCNHGQENLVEEHSLHKDFIAHSIPGFKENDVSPSTLICLIVTSVAILFFSLGYYYLENLKQDTQLAARINSLSAELFFAQKELATAEEKLIQTKDDLQRLVSNSSSNEEEMISMKQELEDNKDVKKKLEQEVKRLEKEIESLVESSNEMHRMLSESISEDERIQALLANIDDLKGVVSSKLEEISSLTNQLDNEKQEVELLTIALKKSEEKKENLEEKLEKIVHEIESKALSAARELEEKIISLERIIEQNTLERVNFEKEIYDLKQQCETLSLEKELAEKSLKKAHGLGPGKALGDWLETKEVRVKLSSTQKEVEKLKTELEETKDHITSLQGREKELLSEIETLNNNYETAEKNKIEALTKLQVLSNYFKEKETQLQEELGEKEAQWLQKQSEDHTIYEQMRSLREENLSYKAQNEALKREILDQEASFKIRIANEEQKAQENWLQLRHTERRLKEVQMEAAHLRSRLTAHETNHDSIEEKHNKSLDMVNGESLGAASPPFMLYPPPDFIPPPPLISPSRPPPLGRLSSPPLTPPPPLSPYDIFPPPPSSPPPPLRVHKPQPREPPQRQKDSQSSTHSSESTEKPVRRGKR